jgi:ATP-dependent Lon protease
VELLGVQARIQMPPAKRWARTSSEYYLREQLRAIQQELGIGDGIEELIEIRKAISKRRKCGGWCRKRHSSSWGAW